MDIVELRKKLNLTKRRTLEEGRVSVVKNNRNEEKPFNIFVRFPGERETQYVMNCDTIEEAESRILQVKELTGIE